MTACVKQEATAVDVKYAAELKQEDTPPPQKELDQLKDGYVQFFCMRGIVYWTTGNGYTPYSDHDTRDPVRCEDFR
jgi:hypothetical protein